MIGFPPVLQFPCRVITKTLKMTFTTSLLDTHHEWAVLRKRWQVRFMFLSDKHLTEHLHLYGRQVAEASGFFVVMNQSDQTHAKYRSEYKVICMHKPTCEANIFIHLRFRNNLYTKLLCF